MKKNILIVEDEPIVALDIHKMLERLQYKPVGHETRGEEAVEAAERLRPDLILMDINLESKLSGIKAAESIYHLFNIPIIFLTAHTDDVTLKKALETGPFGYIPKPFDERMLKTAIESGMYKHEMETKLREKEQWLSTLLRNIGDAVIATNEKGSVTFMNTLAESITGWDMSTARDVPLAKIFRFKNESGKRIRFVFPMDKDINNIGMKDEGGLIGRHNTETPIEYTFNTMKDPANRITGAVLVFRDITERKLAENALRNHQANLKRLSTELINTQEKERANLSREMHDEIGQALTAIKINLEYIKGKLPDQSHRETNERVHETDKLVDEILDQIHRISLDLRPSILDDLGLVPTLKWYINRCAQRMNITIDFVSAEFPQRLQPELETSIYRIVQEALTNIAKHAKAAHVEISLILKKSRIHVTVKDDGKGFNLQNTNRRTPDRRGVGLLGIRERVDLMGGEAEIRSVLDRGTSLDLSFPLREKI